MVAAGGRRTIVLAAIANRVDVLEHMPDGRSVIDEEHVNSLSRRLAARPRSSRLP
jgi:hypothetical protein